jgi:hypothetical protein
MGATNYNHMAGLAALPGEWGAPKMQDYESGRCVYDADSMTGLNRIPVDRLAGYALNGAVFSSAELLPLSPEQVILNLLIDGSWLEVNGIVQTDIIAAAKNIVLQHIPSDVGEVTREWKRTDGLPMTDGNATGAGWVVTDYEDYGTGLQAAKSEPQFVPDDACRYHFNPLSPAGILYPARRSFERLEEIAILIREAQLGPGAKTAIGGYVRNRANVEADLRSRKSWFFTGSDAPLDRMTSTAVVDQLASEFDRLKPLYFQLVYCVDTTNPVQRPSGADRELILDPMFTYVDYVRRMADGVLALYGAEWTYASNKPVAVTPGISNQTDGVDNG